IIKRSNQTVVLLPSNTRFRIFKILEWCVHVAFEQKPMRKPAGVADFQSQAAGNFALETRVENVRVRRLQVRRDAKEIAGNRGDRGRCVWKGLQRVRRQIGGKAVESRTGSEAVGVREVRCGGQANRAVLIVLRDEIAAEPVVDHAGAGAECAGLSEQLSDNAAAALRAVRETEARREIQIVWFPPRRLA